MAHAVPAALQDIENALWGGSNPYSLKGMYAECSGSRSALDVAGSLVTDFAVLPCGGYT